MQYFLGVLVMIIATMPVFTANAGVSINIGQPGFFGRIDIDSVLTPLLIYQEPIVIRPAARSVLLQPIYLYVPPGHAQQWHQHCHRYNACGQPVYFVQEHWYNDVYVPHYREHRHYRERGNDREHRHYRERDNDREHRHYRERDNDRRYGHYRERGDDHDRQPVYVRDHYERGDDRDKHHGKGHGWGHKGHGRGHGKD